MIKMTQDNSLMIRPVRDPSDHQVRQPDGNAKPGFDPRPIQGDASFGHLLNHQRRSQAEQRHQDSLDDDAAELLPLMLSLARLSARAHVVGAVQ